MKGERNSSIEVLRILAMLDLNFLIFIHRTCNIALLTVQFFVS